MMESSLLMIHRSPFSGNWLPHRLLLAMFKIELKGSENYSQEQMKPLVMPMICSKVKNQPPSLKMMKIVRMKNLNENLRRLKEQRKKKRAAAVVIIVALINAIPVQPQQLLQSLLHVAVITLVEIFAAVALFQKLFNNNNAAVTGLVESSAILAE